MGKRRVDEGGKLKRRITMTEIKITFDLSGLDAWVEGINHFCDEMPDACARALNRAGDMAVTQVGRVLSQETGLGVRDIREDVEVEKAWGGDLEYTITVPSRQTTLGEFSPHPTRAGVSARPWGTRRVFPGMFDVRDEVYQSVGKERLPIKPLYGPDPAREAERSSELERVIVETVEEVFPERMQHELQRVWKVGGE